jgi:hypothetical protein
MTKSSLSQKVTHELAEFLWVFLFLAPFFLSFETYRIYLLHESGNKLFDYGTVLINALVLSKVILIGQAARLGHRSEKKPLIVSTIFKAVLFTVLYLIFHVLERTVNALFHGQSVLAALYAAFAVETGGSLVKALAMFLAFIPFFALLEIRRVMGEDQFHRLFLGGGQPNPALARQPSK